MSGGDGEQRVVAKVSHALYARLARVKLETGRSFQDLVEEGAALVVAKHELTPAPTGPFRRSTPNSLRMRDRSVAASLPRALYVRLYSVKVRTGLTLERLVEEGMTLVIARQRVERAPGEAATP